MRQTFQGFTIRLDSFLKKSLSAKYVSRAVLKSPGAVARVEKCGYYSALGD